MDMRDFGLSEEDLRQLGYKIGDEPEVADGPKRGAPESRPTPPRNASPAF